MMASTANADLQVDPQIDRHVHVSATTEADLQAITDLYAHHVCDSLATFEETPPTADEMRRRWQALIANDLPYLSAHLNGDLVGYAYAGPYRTRSAYRFSVEDSIYIKPGYIGKGVGRALLGSLIDSCTQAGYRQMIAVIGDRHNKASIGLHRFHGFEQIGILKDVGFKKGQWVDSVLMQRKLTLPG